ncbi:MAG: IclR family transcriptional regulator [Solirubrobacteraceae bacterium]
MPNQTRQADEAPKWEDHSLREPRYSQSLERGLAILGSFTPERPIRGIADLAEELGMSRPTTHRYVTTLTELGYLEQGAQRKYRLGLRVIDLGMSALNATSLHDHAHRYLEELRQRTSYTISIAILDGQDIILIDRVLSLRRGQIPNALGLRIGSRLPAYRTAMGKVLLANLTEAEQHQLLSSMKLVKRGPNTITSKTALRQELEQVRDEGLAVDDQELAPDVHCIAAPLRNGAREVIAAVDMTATTSAITLEELVDALSPELISTAARISARLGYRRDDETQRPR